MDGPQTQVEPAMETDTQSCKISDLKPEIDTSAPFESVKEAVNRFGGVGYWRPTSNKLSDHEHEAEEISITKLEEQASQLETDLIMKQRETLDVLQELESTRTFVEELKVKLQKEVSQDDEEDKENEGCRNLVEGLMQAHQNLTRTTNGIAEIRVSVEVFNKKLERDGLSLERLTQNSLKMASSEEQLNQTKQKLEGTEILKELNLLNSEAEEFKQMGEAAKSEFLRKISRIERKKAKIRTAQMKLVASAKMKEAARVAEAIALADNNGFKFQQQHQIEMSKMEILMKQVKEATKEIKTTKLALEEALNNMEAAKREKVAVNEALQKWRWEDDKNRPLESYPIGVNGPRLDIYETTPILKTTPSIGQILSRKLFLQEEFMSGIVAEKGSMNRKVSLAQMLGKQNRDMPNCRNLERGSQSDDKQSTRKRKKSGFARFSLFLAKQTKQKRKKPTLDLK